MKWNRLKAVAHKEITQILRDGRSLTVILVMPVVLVLLFGYGVSLDLKHLPVYVWDQENSQDSRDLIKQFQASEYFEAAVRIHSYPEAISALDRGNAKMALVIPWNFSQRLREGSRVSIQALVDASDDNTANILINYAQAVVGGYSQNLAVERAQRIGAAPARASVIVQARTWFNEDLESRAFVLPGVLGLVMSVIGAFLTSLTIAREWERGTMEQLISTPVTSFEIMLGKLFPYFVLGMVAALVSTAITILWFHVPFRGSFWLLLLSTSLFLVVVLSIGFFVSVIAKSQLAASQIALIVSFLPAFLLSGFLFPIEQMPRVVQWITYIVPARYYTSILKGLFLKGSSHILLAHDLIPLAAFSIVLGLMATRAFHKGLN